MKPANDDGDFRPVAAARDLALSARGRAALAVNALREISVSNIHQQAVRAAAEKLWTAVAAASDAFTLLRACSEDDAGTSTHVGAPEDAAERLIVVLGRLGRARAVLYQGQGDECHPYVSVALEALELEERNAKMALEAIHGGAR